MATFIFAKSYQNRNFFVAKTTNCKNSYSKSNLKRLKLHVLVVQFSCLISAKRHALRLYSCVRWISMYYLDSCRARVWRISPSGYYKSEFCDPVKTKRPWALVTWHVNTSVCMRFRKFLASKHVGNYELELIT